MDVTEAIFTRRSIGRSTGTISKEIVRELIAAAVQAPNHNLTQPWRFTVMSGDARKRLGDFWGAMAAENNGLQGEAAETFARAESAKLLRAPVVIAVSVRTEVDDVTASEDQSAGAAAIQNLLLAAHARGLAAMWRTGKMVYDDGVKGFLGLEPSDRILGMIYLGEPDAAPKARPQPNVDDVIRWLD